MRVHIHLPVYSGVTVCDDFCFVGCAIVCRISVTETNKGGSDFRITDNVLTSCDCCSVL